MEELKFLEEQQVASELIKRVEEFRSSMRWYRRLQAGL